MDGFHVRNLRANHDASSKGVAASIRRSTHDARPHERDAVEGNKVICARAGEAKIQGRNRAKPSGMKTFGGACEEVGARRAYAETGAGGMPRAHTRARGSFVCAGRFLPRLSRLRA